MTRSSISGVLSSCVDRMRDFAMLRTLLTVAVAWAAGVAIASIHPVPWEAWMVINILACVIITAKPARKVQAAIGGSYLAAFLAHGAYGINVILDQMPDTSAYINSLNVIGYLRVGLCVAWGVSRLAAMVFAHPLGRISKTDIPAAVAHLEK